MDNQMIKVSKKVARLAKLKKGVGRGCLVSKRLNGIYMNGKDAFVTNGQILAMTPKTEIDQAYQDTTIFLGKVVENKGDNHSILMSTIDTDKDTQVDNLYEGAQMVLSEVLSDVKVEFCLSRENLLNLIELISDKGQSLKFKVSSADKAIVIESHDATGAIMPMRWE